MLLPASMTSVIRMCCNANLSQTFVEFAEDAGFVEHLSLIAVSVIVGDALSKVSRQFAIDHVLFNLLELYTSSHCARHTASIILSDSYVEE